VLSTVLDVTGVEPRDIADLARDYADRFTAPAAQA
jgi:hypothetical protein